MRTELVPVQPDRVTGLAQMFVRSRKSEHTRRSYARHLWAWITWCNGNGVDVLTARHANVLLWLAAREEAGDSGSTRATRLSVLSSWYRWLLREEVVRYNPADLLPEERPTPDPVHTPALSPEQAERLLAAADEEGYRSSALIATLLYTGARIGEVLSATLDSIGQEAGIPVLRVMGKGRRRRALPLIDAVMVRIDRYLLHRGTVTGLPARVEDVTPAVPLFATSTGKAVLDTHVRKIVRRCGQKAGLPPEVVATLTPHSTRATYATTNLAAGVPLRDVQYALGHADPRTTEGYDRSRLSPDRHPSNKLAAVIQAPDLA